MSLTYKCDYCGKEYAVITHDALASIYRYGNGKGDVAYMISGDSPCKECEKIADNAKNEQLAKIKKEASNE